MEYRRLGKTGLKVSALSLGSWLTFGKQISDDVAESLMVKAYESGVNFFDNAEIYANGQSEIVMGNILNKLGWDRSSYVVSSKVFFGDHRKGINQTGLSRKHVMEACHAALKRLQVEYLDLYFCHRSDPETPIEETVFTMNDLIRQGKILYWGTSEWNAQEIMEAHMVAKQYNLIGPAMEQPQYNMFHRRKVEKEFKDIYKHGLGTTIWSPLHSGLLSGKYLDGFPTDTRLGIDGMEWLKDFVYTDEKVAKVKVVKTIADELNVSLPKLALAWCLKNEDVSTVIMGASKLHHLEENLSALEVLPLLTDDVMEQLEEVLQNKPHRDVFAD